MDSPRPPQTAIPVIVFTPSGFIRGTLHLPAVKTLHSFLNGQDEILKLTEAVLPGSDQVHPFLALHKSAITLVVPQGDLDTLRSGLSAMPREQRLVTCLLSLGSIRGHLDVPENLRTSDFLLRNTGFIEFHQCYVGSTSYFDPSEATGEALPMVIVNSRNMVGVTEEAVAPAEAFED
jgi:hypothetical protein